MMPLNDAQPRLGICSRTAVMIRNKPPTIKNAAINNVKASALAPGFATIKSNPDNDIEGANE